MTDGGSVLANPAWISALRVSSTFILSFSTGVYMPSSIAAMIPAILRSTASASRFSSAPARGRLGRCVDLFLVGADELGHQLRGQELVSEPAQDAGLDPLPGDRLVVVAGALGATGGTAITVLADDRVPAAALAAHQELAQQELAPVQPVQGIAGLVLAHLDSGFLLAGFDPLPQVIVDDPKLW